jgi:hypothetical protein
MLLIKGHAVGGIVTTIGLCAQFSAYRNLGCKAHNPYANFIIDECGYCLMDITGVGGK